jgi:hypothetical protein
MTELDLTWSHREGRDRNADRFAEEILLHGSGQILARVFWPQADEFNFRVAFYVYVPATVLTKPDEFHDFIDLESAQRFAQKILLSYDPVGPPAKADTARAEEPHCQKRIPGSFRYCSNCGTKL